MRRVNCILPNCFLKQFICFWLLLLSAGSFEQSSLYRFEQLANNNDLFLSNVLAIEQDKQGYMWFGASSGLYRYNGSWFMQYQHEEKNKYSLSDNNVNVIYFDKDGMMWVGTKNGLNYYNPASGNFQHFLTNKADDKVSGHNVYDIKEDKFGNYWIGTSEAGLYVFFNKKRVSADSLSFDIIQYKSDSSNRFSLPGNWVSSIEFDKDGNGWSATEKGAACFKISATPSTNLLFKRYMHDDHDTSSISDNDLWKIYKDRYQRLWFVTLQGGINLLVKDKQISFRHFYPLKNITKDASSRMLFDILIDKKNRAWIASKQFGLLMYDLVENGNSISFTNMKQFVKDKSNPNSLTNDFVWKIFQDSSGLLWFANYKGINKYNVLSEKFNALNYINPDLKINQKMVRAIYRDNNGNTWFTGDYGPLFLVRANRTTTIEIKSPELSHAESERNFINAILKSRNGNLYLGTDKGIFIYPALEVKKMESGKITGLHPVYLADSGLTKHAAICLTESSQYIYAGTGKGLFKINDKNFSVKHLLGDKQIPVDNLVMRRVSSDQQNNIWIGTDAGLLCYNEKSSLIDIYKHIIGDSSSLSNSEVRYVFTDKNNAIWVGTQFGLNKFIPQTKTFKCYHVSNGLAAEQINGIVQDKSGNLWISTSKGLSEFNPSVNTFRNFTVKEGLNANSLNIYAICASDDDMILVGSDEGFNSFYPDSLSINTKPPVIELSDFKIFSQSILDDHFPKLKDAFQTGKELVLNHQQNFFNISFVALNFLNPEKNQYAYKLEGVDKNWVYCGNNRNANYTDVAPGHYIFKVKATNNDGVWDEKGISIPVTVLPPWWQTWWFRAVMIVVAIVIAGVAIKQYTLSKLRKQKAAFEKQQAIENVRSRISKDIHDEIGSGLTKISLMSQRIKMSFENKKNIDPALLQKITESSKEIIGNLGEIIWTVNPKHDNLVSLLSYVRDYAAHFFEDTTIAYSINFPEEISEINIHPELKRNLFLVIKESLNNIMKHAAATEVRIKFCLDNDKYYFEITDNGKGFSNINGREFGNGLLNMKSRMESVKGSFDIASVKGRGTTVALKGKLYF